MTKVPKFSIFHILYIYIYIYIYIRIFFLRIFRQILETSWNVLRGQQGKRWLSSYHF